MFERINTMMRCQRRRLATLIVALLAVAAVATHIPVSGPHGPHEHGARDSARVVLAICLAVLEAGVVFAASAIWIARRRPPVAVTVPGDLAWPNAPSSNGLGPPGTRPAVLQIFLS